MADSEPQGAPINIITGIENGSKNKPDVSKGTGLLVYTRKRKRTSNKEHEKPNETLEPDAIINQKTTKPRSRPNRGCRLASVHVAESEPISDPGVSHDNGATLSTGSEKMELLYLDNGEGAERFDGENSEIKKKATGKRKPKQRGNKEHEKPDEPLEPDATLNQKTTKPRSRSNRRLSSVHVAESEPQDAPIGDPGVSHDNGDILTTGIENGLKKKAIKRRGNKELDIIETLEPEANLNQKTTRTSSRANRGCRLASVHVAESEPQDGDPGLSNLTTERTVIETIESQEVAVINVENGLKNTPNISSEDTGLLALNNGEGAGTFGEDSSKIKKKATGKRKRKQRGNKEHEKTDETLKPNAISSQKVTKPRLKPNRGCHLASKSHDAPIGEKTLIDPSTSKAPPETAITGTENATSANETCKKRKVLVNWGGDKGMKGCVKNGIRKGSSHGEIRDEETVGSFFGRLKKKRRLA